MMARMIKREAETVPAVREYLRIRYAARSAAYPRSPWRRLVERLDAGEPVLVYGWQLQPAVPGLVRDVQYEVGADGSIEVERTPLA